MKWRVASASAIGTSHERTGQPCQDYNACRLLTDSSGKSIVVLVASDGAGSALRGAEGAQLACEIWISEAEALLQAGGTLSEISREFMVQWIERFLLEVNTRASASGLRCRDYACTFLTALISDESAVYAQIGDGVIVIEDLDQEDDYCWIFWPQRGEYESQTHFLTDQDAALCLEHTLGRPVNEVAIMTDGLQRLSLHFQSRSAHNPFFRSVFGRLRTTTQTGYVRDLSRQLEQLLLSEHINSRTDDDKTLILATRKPTVGDSGSEEQV